MRIDGPERYTVRYTPTQFAVTCQHGTSRFSGLAMLDVPKLYVVSVANTPVYVGQTKRPIRERLSYGWKATGKGGYYGYRWRHSGELADLAVWAHRDAVERNERDMETIEAEVVFLIRLSGQWPEFQTEIHFHPSQDEHRVAARRILGLYGNY